MSKPLAGRHIAVLMGGLSPEREISLVTVRGRLHSPALGALVHEVMQTKWMGADAIAVQKIRAEPELTE